MRPVRLAIWLATAFFVVMLFTPLVREMADKFEPLRFTSGKRVQWLTEPQIPEPNFFQDLKWNSKFLPFLDRSEKLDGFTNRELEDVVNRLAMQPDAKDVLKQAFADAEVPADVEVYSSLHGWCVPDMPAEQGKPIYNKPDAEKAWATLIALYKQALA